MVLHTCCISETFSPESHTFRRAYRNNMVSDGAFHDCYLWNQRAHTLLWAFYHVPYSSEVVCTCVCPYPICKVQHKELALTWEKPGLAVDELRLSFREISLTCMMQDLEESKFLGAWTCHPLIRSIVKLKVKLWRFLQSTQDIKQNFRQKISTITP